MTSSEQYKLNRQNPEWLSAERERDRNRWRLKHPKRTIDPDLEGEVWLSIVGHKGYLVSNKGRVKNAKGYIMTLQNMTSGYLYVRVKSDSGEYRNISIHRSVMMAFKPQQGQFNLIVNHKDFNKKNNDVTNLEWVTMSENVRHAREGGRFDDHLNKISLLNKSKIAEAVQDFRSGTKIKELASRYSVTYKAMHKIIRKAICKQ